MPDPNILRPASQWKVEGQPRGCWGRYHASSDVWGSQSLFPDTWPPWVSAALRSHDGSTACAGRQGQRAITAPDAGWKAQPLRSTQGAAAGCWQVEGVPRGPGGNTEAQDPRSDRHLWGQMQTKGQGPVRLDARMPGWSGGVQAWGAHHSGPP
ncbi:unnamed protein product [Rangifer tarandus platyrhynchus]|uniref:Uncharacterized protein n=1 Tax=Rangifer tarandus platyrhynchus TaxID=3082113 RepID=A0ABN8ZMG7_RANTA|nr:unnamed protein product [Rangifer tarandus platyrhynchus]